MRGVRKRGGGIALSMCVQWIKVAHSRIANGAGTLRGDIIIRCIIRLHQFKIQAEENIYI